VEQFATRTRCHEARKPKNSRRIFILSFREAGTRPFGYGMPTAPASPSEAIDADYHFFAEGDRNVNEEVIAVTV
jgi:hypothetical protein